MKKILIIIGSVIVFLAILASVYWFFIQGRMVVKTNVADSQISVNDLAITKGSLDQQFKRGTYKIKITRSEYPTYTKNITVYGWQTKKWSLEMTRLPKKVLVKEDVTTITRNADMDKMLVSEDKGTNFSQFDPKTDNWKRISRLDFGSAIKVRWSPEGFLAFIWRGDGKTGLVDLKRYDLLSQEYFAWEKGVLDLAWRKDGDSVIYTYKPGDGEFSLMEASPLNKNPKRLYFHLDREGMTDPKIELTKDQKDVLLVDKDIFVFNFYLQKLTKLTKTGDIKAAKLSFNGKYIIYSVKSGFYLTKLDGTQTKRLDDSFDLVEWLPNGKEIIGFDKGQWRKVNIQTGGIIKYGYNGEKIGLVDSIMVIKNLDRVYFLSSSKLYKLDLQNRLVEFNPNGRENAS